MSLTVTGSGDDNDAGQIILARASNRSVVTVNWMAEKVDGLGGTRDCLFLGTSQVSKP